MSRSIFQSGAALLSVAAFGAASTLGARAANAAATATIFDAPTISQAGFADFTRGNHAKFDGERQLASGGETLENISGLSSSRSQNFNGVAVDKYALGSSTVSSVDDESLYVYSGALASLDSAPATGKDPPSIFPTDVGEFTTVPIPAAVWLLGAGLFGFIAVARPRRLVAKGPPQAAHAATEKRPHGELVKPRDRISAPEYRWYAAYSSWPGELC